MTNGTNDWINAAFETVAGFMVFLSVYRTWKEKEFRGVSPVAVGFFTAWGIWYLYYSITLDQWRSFYGGISSVIANLMWLYLMYKYRKPRTITLQEWTELVVRECESLIAQRKKIPGGHMTRDITPISVLKEGYRVY
jgi:hypothetical protein